MGIQADRWITRMAREHRMIEPFEGRQVREGVISYGVSSYGYDMRVATEFKIFTNVLNSIVDPKAFDPKSFVEFEGDVCIVPPNSFALARSVEYFRIPRDVVTLCVGKSTYARCFTADTRVALVDGTDPTLEELTRRSEAGEMFWGYSFGQYGQVIVTRLEAPRHVERAATLELALDSGETIRCTHDHRFVLRGGATAQAADLEPGDSLMPLYRQLVRGYEAVYQPLNGHLEPTHRMADDWNVRHGMYGNEPGTHRRHRDHNRRNNAPWNLERMPASEHVRHHNADTYGEEFLSRQAWTRDTGERRARQREIARTINLRAEIDEAAVRSALNTTGSVRGAARLLGCDRSVFRRFPDVIAGVRGRPVGQNHKVAAVRSVPGEHDVYCLTVPEAGNFALAAGVFVENCGVITNVTPFEPEWEGFVTLEISNTTPLPAKIYANEGIAQVLFFKGDEPPEVSYADKKGKYQKQQGVTGPRL